MVYIKMHVKEMNRVLFTINDGLGDTIFNADIGRCKYIFQCSLQLKLLMFFTIFLKKLILCSFIDKIKPLEIKIKWIILTKDYRNLDEFTPEVLYI